MKTPKFRFVGIFPFKKEAIEFAKKMNPKKYKVKIVDDQGYFSVMKRKKV